MSSSEYCKNLQKTYFQIHLWTTASIEEEIYSKWFQENSPLVDIMQRFKIYRCKLMNFRQMKYKWEGDILNFSSNSSISSFNEFY